MKKQKNMQKAIPLDLAENKIKIKETCSTLPNRMMFRKHGTTLDVVSRDESSTADGTQELAEDLLEVCTALWPRTTKGDNQ